MKRMLFGVTLCLLLGSCSSSRRMMRISPFAETSAEKTAVLSDENRVNMWPLAYHNAGTTSLLWPFIDFDKDGFAVRPILNKDKDDWAVLWPLAGWDASSGEGWVANTVFETGEYVAVIPIGLYNTEGFGYLGTAYWKKDNFWGLFPLVHVEPDERGCVLTTYWNEDGFGTFPLFHFGDGGGYVGPFWAGGNGFGLFPLYSYHGSGTDSSHKFLLGFAGYEGGADEHKSWMFPLWYDEAAPDSRTQFLLPFYYYEGNKDDYLFATLAGGCYGDGSTSGEWLLPFWWSERGPGRSRHLLFPLAYNSRDGDKHIFASLLGAGGSDGDESWKWLFPTYWSSQSATEHKRVLWPFWFERDSGELGVRALVPFFYHTSEGDAKYTYTPLGNWYKDGGKEGLNVYPLWWSAKEGSAKMSSLIPFYFYKEKGESHTLVTSLGGYGWHDTQDDYFVNVLGPLYHHQESNDGNESLTAVAWPLYTGWRDGDERHQLIPGLYHLKTDPSETDASFLGGLGRYVADGNSTSTMLWPLMSTSTAEEMPNLMWDLNLFHWRRSATVDSTRLTPLAWSERKGDRRSRAILPFYHGVSTPTEESHYFLAWTGGYHSGPTGSSWRFWPIAGYSNENERPDFLYYLSLMGGHSFGEDYAWHVTPFIGSTGDADDSFSWALPMAWWWRDKDEMDAYFLAGLGNYDTDAKGTSWHLMPLIAHSSKTSDPGFGHWLSLFRSWTSPAGESQYGITPLINYYSKEDQHEAWIFPLCFSSKTADESDLHSLVGLQHYGKTNNGWSFRLTPAVSCSTTDDAEDGFNWFSALNLKFHDDKKLVSVLGPFGMRYEKQLRRDGGTYRDLNYLLFGASWNHDEADDEVPRTDKSYRQMRVNEKGSGLFPIYRNNLETFRVWGDDLSDEEEQLISRWWHRFGWFNRHNKRKQKPSDEEVVKILRKHGVEADAADRDKLKQAVLAFAKKHSDFRETRDFTSLPFTYERSGKDIDWKFLFGVAGYKHVESQDQSTLSFLRYLYRRERKGTEVRRTFFPFTKWDSGEEKTSISFCWHLFNYRRNGENKSGHFLFIPWGKRG